MQNAAFRPAVTAAAVVVAAAAMIGVVVSGQSRPGGAQAAPPTQSQDFPDYPKVNLAEGYRLAEGWPKKPAEFVWGAMTGISVDNAGNVWTVNRGNEPVQIYRADGTFVRTWNEKSAFKNPHQLRLDREGNVWVADNGFHTVTKFAPDGKVLLTLGTKDVSGEDQTHLNQPTDMAVLPSGDVFISDGYVNSRVVHYDKAGRFVKAWGKLGTGPGEFSLAHGIAADSKGRLYVVDRNNTRVQVFEQSGKYVTEWRNIINPWAIWITPADEIYVCGSTPAQWWEVPKGGVQMNGVPAKDQIVVKFDTEGRVKRLWAFPVGLDPQGTRPGQLNWVHSLAVDKTGALYLGDIRGRKAQKFDFVAAGAAMPAAAHKD